MNTQMRNRYLPMTLMVVLTAVIVGGSVYFLQQKPIPDVSDTNNQQSIPTPVDPQADWQAYKTPEIEFKYPASYQVTEPTDIFKALVVSGPHGKLEIFKSVDFSNRPFGFSGEETQAEIDGYVPKEIRKKSAAGVIPGAVSDSAYETWLYWTSGNQASSDEIQAIANTVQIKK